MDETEMHKFMRDEPDAVTVNVLSESEWRTIHNALSHYQNLHTDKLSLGFWRDDPKVAANLIKHRTQIQQLMDKVRDNYIAHNEQQSL